MAMDHDDHWYEEEVEDHISWGAILAGAVIAVATGAMLNVLGLAIGAFAADPFRPSDDQATALSVAGGIWIAVSNILGLALGGYVAARAAPIVDRDEGMIHGLAVWAVAFLLAIFIAGSTFMGAANSLLGGLAERASPAAVARTDDAAAAAVAPRNQEEAEDAADATATAAFWAFVQMLLGGAAALGGARAGSGPINWNLHPNARRHHHH